MKNTLKRRYTLILLALLLPLCSSLTSCSDDDSATVPTLEIGKATVDFKSESGNQNIIIATNIDSWTAKSDKSWCHTTVHGETLNISVDESDERYVREATITVTAADQTKTIKVRQLGYEPAILIDEQTFEVSATGGDIQFSITTNVEVEIKRPDWITTKPKSRALPTVTTEHTYTVKASAMDNKRQDYIEVIEILPEAPADTEQIQPMKALISVTQRGLNEYAEGNGEDVNGDIKIKVVSGHDTSHQGDSDITKSFDGDYSTIYHSNWSNSGSNYFPITLTYNFEAATDVDYLIYYPRPSGPNGRFKEVEISYSEDGSNFTKLLDKDFLGSAAATKVTFDNSVKAKSFRFVVKSGAGDGQGFASCAEMEFYAKNPENFKYETLFTDPTCSELKNGITEEDIAQCEYPFFKNIAYYMLKGKYPSEFRISEYKAYPNPDIQSATHKTNPYSQLDNPTGIGVKAGDNLIVLVGDTHGYDIGIRVQNLDSPGDGFGGETYPLSKGINKLTMNSKGLIYVMYHTAELDQPTAEPIKIHFATGEVNGYFDSQNPNHNGRWSELLGKATNRYFDVVGKYAHLTFETADFRSYTGSKGKELIDLYDQIVYNEQELMGLVHYDKMFRNRMYLHVIYTPDAYMYATAYHTAYVRGTMSELCNPTKLSTSSCWGPAHEIGHCNQTRPGILWGGNTEVTNNIMSEYIQTTIFGQPSRIQTEDMGVAYRNRYSKAWNGIIATGSPHAKFTDLGKGNSDVFCKLIPFWQLELYFGRVLGRTPLQHPDKGGFYPEVYEYARNKDYTGMSHGALQLDFVYACSKIAQMNLLDFFEKWGFLTPVDVELDDYGKKQLTVTQEMIDDLKQKVEALGYPKPDVALEYISDNTYELYTTKPAIIPGPSATHSAKTFTQGSGANATTYNGESITIKNWQNAVTYEVKDADDNFVFICSGEQAPSDTDTFCIPVRWQSGFKLYAVSVTGERIPIPMD